MTISNENKITQDMAETIAACMNWTISPSTVIAVIRENQNYKDEESLKRNETIRKHYDRLMWLTNLHLDNYETDVREYVRECQKKIKN